MRTKHLCHCETYIGRYNSAFDYLSDVLTPGRGIEMRLRRQQIEIILLGEQATRIAPAARPRLTTTASSTAGATPQIQDRDDSR